MPIVKANPMKKNPLISAIIPAYSEELNIANAIESALNQNYKNIEVIIVENGDSKDKTYEIAKSYDKKHKNVHAYTIPGKQNGPANALIYAFKKSKGEIIWPIGADLTHDKDYAEKGIVPVVKGKTVGTNHIWETCKNYKNIWARAFFYKRKFVGKNNIGPTFVFIRRDFLAKNMWDPKLGYGDDKTINKKTGTEFPGLNLGVYQNNPDTPKEHWEHALWVAKSMNKTHVILGLSLLPFYSIYKTIKHFKEDFYLPFIIFLPFYYSFRYLAYFRGVLRSP